VLDLLPAQLPAPAAGWFSTRGGGRSNAPYDALNLGAHVGDDVSAVDANRALLARAAGLPQGALALMQQVHGAEVAVVDGPEPSAVPAVDALVTTARGVGLVVLAADCLPVLFADPTAGVIAVAHAGRRGLVAGVLQETLAAMQRLGARPASTSVVVGPAACGRCYEVPQDMADGVGTAVPGARATSRQGTPSVDLTAGALALLERAGVMRPRAVGGCTLEQPARWFSYRRSAVTGRHAGLVRLA
jgi:YfiH family protein